MTEKEVAEKLIDLLLEADCAVSIDDDIEESKDRSALIENLAICDVQIVAAGQGWLQLVWGNATDGSELISDYSDNEFTNAIYEKVYPGA